jgi:O-antigen ligase
LFESLYYCFFSLIILLLSSKLALISCLLIFIGVGIYRILHSKNYFTGIVFLLLFIAASASIIYTVPELNQRIQNARVVLNVNSIDKTDAESNAVRILVWQAATAAFLENGIVGTGTGDVKDELFKHYKLNGYTGALEHRLNAHNQFLQTGVALGYFGFVLFLLSIIVPTSIALKNKNYVYVSFVVLVVLNFLTESMLESEAGVFIYAFFNSLLFFRKI